MKKSFVIIFVLIAISLPYIKINAKEKPAISITKHMIKAPVPFKEPNGSVTPDGSFNIRDPKAPFHSEKLADAMMLDEKGKDENGNYLDLNNAIYTIYKLANDKKEPDTIIVLMPDHFFIGSGAMSMDQYARDFLRLADESGRSGLQIWLHDRRSEQLEDHTGMRYAIENPDGLQKSELIQTLLDYYRPAFQPDEKGKVLYGRKLVPLDLDSIEFMANWGADVAIRDWRAVVLEANRRIGNEVKGTDVDRATVTKKPGRHVFIGRDLTELYSAYDFDRRPGYEILGRDDVSGLILLGGGKASFHETHDKLLYENYLKEEEIGDLITISTANQIGSSYTLKARISKTILFSLTAQAKIFFGISGWAAENARGQKSVIPKLFKPEYLHHKNITNEAVLGFVWDDDTCFGLYSIVSIGIPTGSFGRNGQLRNRIIDLKSSVNECSLITTWNPGHKLVDKDLSL